MQLLTAPVCTGMCFGHRKLIQLSPKKTWEGFIGGCFTTVVASWYLAGFMSRFKWMTCPRTVLPDHVLAGHQCTSVQLLQCILTSQTGATRVSEQNMLRFLECCAVLCVSCNCQIAL